MTVDLKSMSRKELLKLKKDVEKAILAAENREKQEALKAAEKAVAEFGFTLKDLQGQAAKPVTSRTKSPAKYRNPNNPDQTWTGRGRKPQWVHDALAAGVDMADLEI